MSLYVNWLETCRNFGVCVLDLLPVVYLGSRHVQERLLESHQAGGWGAVCKFVVIFGSGYIPAWRFFCEGISLENLL